MSDYDEFEQTDTTAKDNINDVVGENKGYKAFLGKDKMSDETRDHYGKVKDLTRRAMKLETFHDDSNNVRGELNTLSNLIGHFSKERELLYKEMSARSKTEEFRKAIDEDRFVDAKDYHRLVEIMKHDQNLLPMYALMVQTALFGFKNAGSLVKVETIVLESERFLGTIKEMVKDNSEQMKEIVKHSRELNDSTINNANKRQDEDIHVLRKNMNKITINQIICNSAVEVNQRNIIELQGHPTKPKEYSAVEENKPLNRMAQEQKEHVAPQQPPKEPVEIPLVPDKEPGQGFTDADKKTREIDISNYVASWYKTNNSFHSMFQALNKRFEPLTSEDQDFIIIEKAKFKPKED